MKNARRLLQASHRCVIKFTGIARPPPGARGKEHGGERRGEVGGGEGRERVSGEGEGVGGGREGREKRRGVRG